MMILKAKDKEIEILIKTRTAQTFEEKVCENDDETLLTILPQKAIGKGKIEFMVKLLNHFQVNKVKLPILSDEEYDENGIKIKDKEYDMYDFLDDWCEENKELSITDLYCQIIEMFDVSGIIERGLGFKMVKVIKETMKNAIDNMDVKKED